MILSTARRAGRSSLRSAGRLAAHRAVSRWRAHAGERHDGGRFRCTTTTPMYRRLVAAALHGVRSGLFAVPRESTVDPMLLLRQVSSPLGVSAQRPSADRDAGSGFCFAGSPRRRRAPPEKHPSASGSWLRAPGRVTRHQTQENIVNDTSSPLTDPLTAPDRPAPEETATPADEIVQLAADVPLGSAGNPAAERHAGRDDARASTSTSVTTAASGRLVARARFGSWPECWANASVTAPSTSPAGPPRRSDAAGSTCGDPTLPWSPLPAALAAAHGGAQSFG
jgi:hypothetical protein